MNTPIIGLIAFAAVGRTSAFANCGRAVAHVRGSYGPISHGLGQKRKCGGKVSIVRTNSGLSRFCSPESADWLHSPTAFSATMFECMRG
jgi:hypothetical protein